MINVNHELLIEIWSRIKANIPPKERLEVADTLVVIFDEFGFIEDTLADEDLDRELKAAVRSHMADVPDDIEEDDDDNYSY